MTKYGTNRKDVIELYTPDVARWFYSSDLPPLPRTLENTVPGDVIVSSGGNKYEVIVPDGYVIHKGESGAVYANTPDELKRNNYTLFQPQDDAIKQAIELLTKNGIIRDGKVIEL